MTKTNDTVVDRSLTVLQPWAWAIARGHKSIENRTWSTPFRGRFAVHASSGKRGLDYFIEFEKLVKSIDPKIYAEIDDVRITKANQIYHAGCILGTVELIGIVDWPEDSPLSFEKCCAAAGFGDWYRSQQYPPAHWAQRGKCWLLQNAVQFAVPIPAKGALNLWSMPPDLAAKVAAAKNGPFGSPVAYRHKAAAAVAACKRIA